RHSGVLLRRPGGGGRDLRCGDPRVLPRHRHTAAGADVRPRLRQPEPAGQCRAGVVRHLPGGLRARGGQPMSTAPAEAPTRMPMAKAINNGLRQAMERDSKVVLMGEDIGTLGGVFRVTDGLQKDFGEERVVDTPLAESGIIGTAIGMAMAGYRPVCEIQFDGFIFPGFNQITTQLAKMSYRSRGR